MKANHNVPSADLVRAVTMVNIGMSKNESKSQLYAVFAHFKFYYGKYRHVKE